MKYTMKHKVVTATITAAMMFGSLTVLPSPAAHAAQTAEVTWGVNMRTAPSTSGSVIRMIKKGEHISIIANEGKYWYKVSDARGRVGYISSASKYTDMIASGGTGSASGGTSTPSAGTGTPSVSSNASVEKVIAAGMKYWGTPYEFGSNRSTTTTFDCSDFVRQAFKDALGITLPGDSRKQGAYVKNKGNYTTDISKLKRGDLMFFMSYKGSKASSYSGLNKQSQRITHVGIYLGDGKILHTYSNESGGVTTSTVTGKHWEYRFIFGGSAL